MVNSDFKYYLKDHFESNLVRYYLLLFSGLIGVILGVILLLTGFSNVSLLKITDKTLIDYISGSVGYGSIFISRLINMLFSVLIIFLFNLIRQTSFLNYIFICYQTCLLTLLSNAIISVYSIAGILSVLIIIVPINLVNIFLLSYLSCVCMKRAYETYHYKLNLAEGFKEKSFWFEILLAILMLFIFCILNSFVLPILVRSFVIVSY